MHKRLFITAVRDMPWILGNLTHGIQLEPPMLLGELLVTLLTGRIPQFTTDTTAHKDGCVLGNAGLSCPWLWLLLASHPG